MALNIVSRLKAFPGAPAIVRQIFLIAYDPYAHLAQVLHIISKDPALAAKLLRAANSTIYPDQLQAGARAAADQSRNDALTGAYDHQQVDAAPEIEFAVAGRTNSPLSVVFIDLDHFKLINSRYDDGAGNEVLRSTARLVRASLRGAARRRWGQGSRMQSPRAARTGTRACRWPPMRIVHVMVFGALLLLAATAIAMGSVLPIIRWTLSLTQHDLLSIYLASVALLAWIAALPDAHAVCRLEMLRIGGKSKC